MTDQSRSDDEAERLALCAAEPEHDIGNARRFLTWAGDDVRHVTHVGWHVFDKRRWQEDESGAIVRRLAHHAAESIYRVARILGPRPGEQEALDAARVAREAMAAPFDSKSATREELSGSTITITSLGALGGIATTPVINHPEVAIVGVNKMQVRPMWDGTQFVPKKMMNLSSSFDHRVVDGWDAAVFVQRVKALLETPASIFIEE